MGEAQEEGNMETDKIDNSEICTQFIWYLRNRLHLTLFGTVGRGLGYFFSGIDFRWRKGSWSCSRSCRRRDWSTREGQYGNWLNLKLNSLKHNLFDMSKANWLPTRFIFWFSWSDKSSVCSWTPKTVKELNTFNLQIRLLYSCNKITTTWIQISHQNWNGFFSNASHQIMN